MPRQETDPPFPSHAPSAPAGRAPAGTEPAATGPADVGPWRRRSRETVYANPWIEIHHDEVDRPDGGPGIYGVVHFRSRAVGVVAVDHFEGTGPAGRVVGLQRLDAGDL